MPIFNNLNIDELSSKLQDLCVHNCNVKSDINDYEMLKLMTNHELYVQTVL